MGTFSGPSTSHTLLRLLCDADVKERAWQTFLERYQPVIRRWCGRWRLQAADVDDVTQNILLKVFNQLKSFDPGRGHFRSWLKRTAQNAVVDFFRYRKRHQAGWAGEKRTGPQIDKQMAETEHLDELAEDLAGNLENDLQAIRSRVQARVQPQTWRVFEQAELEGQPKDVVAKALGKTYAAVCMSINRVKKIFREEWAKYHAGQPPSTETAP